MFKRAFWLGLLLASTQLATGCCGYYGGGWCNRPYIFPRPWMAAYAPGGNCCGATAAPAFDYGPPPIAPGVPGTMPKTIDLSRR